MNLKDFALDTAAEEEGKWFDLEGARFHIGAHGNRKHRKALQKIEKANRIAVQRRDQVKIEELTIQATVDGLLYGWEGVKDGDQDVPFTRAKAIEVLTRYRIIRDWVAEQALSLQNFAKEEEEAQKGELKSGSEVASPVGSGA